MAVQDPHTDPHDGKTDLCCLLHCLLDKRVIGDEARKRLLAYGINLDALQRCLGQCCDGDAAVSPKQSLSVLEALDADTHDIFIAGCGAIRQVALDACRSANLNS